MPVTRFKFSLHSGAGPGPGRRSSTEPIRGLRTRIGHRNMITDSDCPLHASLCRTLFHSGSPAGGYPSITHPTLIAQSAGLCQPETLSYWQTAGIFVE